MDCKIRGCRSLETICSDCKRVVCTYSLESKWKLFKDHEPPTGVRLLVKKHFINHDFDVEIGGYDDTKPVKTASLPDVDIYWEGRGWVRGGVVTEWMEIPE